jgi:hypothetical protein
MHGMREKEASVLTFLSSRIKKVPEAMKLDIKYDLLNVCIRLHYNSILLLVSLMFHHRHTVSV